MIHCSRHGLVGTVALADGGTGECPYCGFSEAHQGRELDEHEFDPEGVLADEALRAVGAGTGARVVDRAMPTPRYVTAGWRRLVLDDCREDADQAHHAPGWYVQAHGVRDSIFGFNGVDWIRYAATEVTNTVPSVGGLVPLGVSSERS